MAVVLLVEYYRTGTSDEVTVAATSRRDEIFRRCLRRYCRRWTRDDSHSRDRDRFGRRQRLAEGTRLGAEDVRRAVLYRSSWTNPASPVETVIGPVRRGSDRLVSDRTGLVVATVLGGITLMLVLNHAGSSTPYYCPTLRPHRADPDRSPGGKVMTRD